MKNNLFEGSKPATFFGQIKKCITVAQLSHWATKSYPEHIALEKFYEEAADKLDEMVECYQGWKKTRINIDVPACEYMNAVYLIDEASDLIDQYRSVFASNSVFLNLMDELQAIVYRIRYLLSLS